MMKYYVRKPFYIQVQKVTDDTMEQVAVWCRGKIDFAPPRNGKPGAKFIQVVTPNIGENAYHTRAYVGNYVVCMGGRFKVYTERALHNDFELVEQPFPETEGEYSPPIGKDAEKVNA